MNSIKSYLISWVLGIVITGVLIISYISYLETKHEIEELFDAELITTAKMFLRFMDFKGSQKIANSALLKKQSGKVDIAMVFNLPDKLVIETGSNVLNHEYEGKIAFRIYNDKFSLLAESFNSPNYFPQSLQEGFVSTIIDNKKWHLFVLYEKNKKLWLVTAQHDEIRQELVENILSYLVFPSIVGMPVLIFLIWFFLGKGLKPLNLMAQAIGRRHPEHLEPLHLKQVPDEIHPIINALNHLFDRLSKTIEREKRFTADAAHELRTPLSILKIHAQNAQAAENKHDLNRSLDLLLHGVDKSTHLIEQLLKLARIEPKGADKSKFKLVNITRLLKEQYALQVPAALKKQQDINIILPETDIKCQVDELVIELLIRNLLDNAIRYCPSQGTIEVGLKWETLKQCFSLSFKNNGEFISAEHKSRLFERFYRINPGTSGGSGLGLSIVKQCVAIHQAEIKLPNTDSGLHIVILFNC
ncbi:MAG: ATP-binding protein [Pseudomonadota bacterium]